VSAPSLHGASQPVGQQPVYRRGVAVHARADQLGAESARSGIIHAGSRGGAEESLCARLFTSTFRRALCLGSSLSSVRLGYWKSVYRSICQWGEC